MHRDGRGMLLLEKYEKAIRIYGRLEGAPLPLDDDDVVGTDGGDEASTFALVKDPLCLFIAPWMLIILIKSR